ncbi:hypothetical protein LCGC14_3040430 [marine sediment metagenome]|uniref:Uncharacterized protein n=1 Tax=marine sediment metagenome TaxID=412755 RepID=A0A0F8WQ98_9ZZZZ
MIPTPIDLRRVERAVREFGIDPRKIGTNHIRWWFITPDDWVWSKQGYNGHLIVMARDYPYCPLPEGVNGEKPTIDLKAIRRENFVEVPNASKEEGCVFYIFKPLKEE